MIASGARVNIVTLNDKEVEQKFIEEILKKINDRSSSEQGPAINVCGDLSNMKGINPNEEIQIDNFGKMISVDGVSIPQSAIKIMVELGTKYNILQYMDTISKNIECIKEFERESYIELSKLKNKKTNEDYTFISSHCHGEIDTVLHDINITAILNSVEDIHIMHCRKVVRMISESILEDMKNQNPNKKFDFDVMQDIKIYTNY